MFNMLKVYREVFGRWVTATPSKPRRNPKPHRILPRLEELEGRLVPAPMTTTWTDATGDHLASTAGNWTSGKPNATTQAILDGQKTMDAITFDAKAAPYTCDGILVKNDYIGKMTLQGAVSSNATVEIQSGSVLSLIAPVASGNPLKLTNGAAILVDSGSGGLVLDDNNSVSTFVTGDGMAGEILKNYGNVAYLGTAGGGNNDLLKIPVLNNGSFSLLTPA